MKHLAAIIALALTATPAAFSQEAADLEARFAASPAVAPTIDGVAVAGPIVLRHPGDIPPTTHEQVRKLMARLDNAYPDVDDARKLAFIADYLDISFRRLWNAYYGDRPHRPDVDARPVHERRADRARPDDKPRAIDVRPARPAPTLRPSPAMRPAATRPTVTRPTRPN